MRQRVIDNIVDQQGKYLPLKSEINKLKVGDVVALKHKKLSYYPDGIVSHFINVVITYRSSKKYFGKILEVSEDGIITEIDGIKFSEEDIVKTPYDGLDVDLLNFYHNYTVQISRDALLQREVQFMKLQNKVLPNDTGWLLLSGDENIEELSIGTTVIEVPVYELLYIDHDVVLQLFRDKMGLYQRNEYGGFNFIAHSKDEEELVIK